MKNIKGFKNYKVTDNGTVINASTGRVIKPYLNRSKGYLQVKLWNNGVRVTKQVSRLVKGEPKGLDVDHIDNNKYNNHKSNLQSISHRDNVKKSYMK